MKEFINMFKFDDKIVENTVNKLLNGEDYRSEVITAIDMNFFSSLIDFLKTVKSFKDNPNENDNPNDNTDWYSRNLINMNDANEGLLNAGLNKKTVFNIRKSATKEILIREAMNHYQEIKTLLNDNSFISEDDFSFHLSLTDHGVTTHLNFFETLIAINAIATKKMSLRGGAWSSIGKKVEKELLYKLCKLCGVQEDNIGAPYKKDGKTDREYDFLLKNDQNEYRVEVKLMGKGNPESADAVFARDSKILIADTLNENIKEQCKTSNILTLELTNKKQNEILDEFKVILKKLNIPNS